MVLGLVVVSPLFAESLAGYDSTTGDPAALLGGLLFFGPLYGCPALLIREIARRFRVGWGGIAVLSAGFGVLQAGVIDQSMFVLTYRDIPYWDDMVRPTLIEPLGFAGYTAMVFIGGHVVWSFCTPIVLVESLGGARARVPWLRWRGLIVAGVLYLAVAALILVDHLRTQVDHASGAQVGGALTVVVVLFAGALTLGRERGASRGDLAVPSVRVVGLLSLVAALGFNFVPYSWPGVAGGMALAVLAAGDAGRLSLGTLDRAPCRRGGRRGGAGQSRHGVLRHPAR
ncbi:hypothetical protein [Spirillospora albida]|uniref:hypothetical protein n=1 Tax=Spirillospora albida TaxID=58123 RepID=UPI00068DD167|nr:hypothetical protein [Spirillospora albida]